MKNISRIIRVNSAAVGMKLYSAVHSRNGVLLKAGEVLTPTLVTQLASWGITHVRILLDPSKQFDYAAPDVKVPDMKERGSYKKLLSSFRRGTSLLDSESSELRQQVVGSVKDIFAAMQEYPSAMVALTSVDGPGEGYLLRHSTNVCILSIACGMWLGFSDNAIKDLGIAALLHDMGMTRVKGLPWQNNRELNENERHEVRKHTIIGRDILEGHPGLGIAATVAHQHHENSDGSGYPRGLVGGRLHPYSRIVAACDRYEAIASTRAHRKGAGPYKALQKVLADAGRGIDQKAAQVLMSNLSLYPVGTRVRLSDGRVAWVVSPGAVPFRPIIQPVGEKTPLDLAGTAITISAPMN